MKNEFEKKRQRIFRFSILKHVPISVPITLLFDCNAIIWTIIVREIPNRQVPVVGSSSSEAQSKIISGRPQTIVRKHFMKVKSVFSHSLLNNHLKLSQIFMRAQTFSRWSRTSNEEVERTTLLPIMRTLIMSMQPAGECILIKILFRFFSIIAPKLFNQFYDRLLISQGLENECRW